MRKRLGVILLVLPLAAWGLFAIAGKRVAAWAAARFAARLLALANGKFTNTERFVYFRLRDLVVLLAAASVIALVWLAFVILCRRFFATRAQWILQAVAGFVCLNCFAAIAARTVLFWCLLFSGAGATHNYTQYRIKEGLMREIEAREQAVLFGSSQTRAEIDEGVLNNLLSSNIWTTELHFPGNRPYDMVLNLESLPPVSVSYAVCYLSEGYFYTGTESEGLMFFFGFRDLSEYRRLRQSSSGLYPKCFLGLLGDALPLFKYREPIAGRLFGFRAVNINQERYNEGLDASLTDRAKTTAPRFRLGPEADFQKRAFLKFAEACGARHCRLVVCCGQLNPILEKELDPALRRDMTAFLKDCAAHDTNVVLLQENDLPPQSPQDYDDLTHVNVAAQAKFSEYIAGVLGKLQRQGKSLLQEKR